MNKPLGGTKTMAAYNNLAIARGDIAGASNMYKYGSNADVTNTLATIWDHGAVAPELYNWIPSALALKIVSTSLNDSLLGSGMRTGAVFGLDANYAEKEQSAIEMDGQDEVNLSTTWLRADRIKAITAGASGWNEGTVYVFSGSSTNGVPDDPTKIYAIIPPLRGQTRQAVYTIPAGKTGYSILITGSAAVTAGTALISVFLRTRELGGAWNAKPGRTFVTGASFEIPIEAVDDLPEKTDIELMGIKLTAGTAVVNGEMNILMYDNS